MEILFANGLNFNPQRNSAISAFVPSVITNGTKPNASVLIPIHFARCIIQMTSQRKNISQPADWWVAFSEQANRKGESLSEWIGDCCQIHVDTDLQYLFSERNGRGRPKSNDQFDKSK